MVPLTCVGCHRRLVIKSSHLEAHMALPSSRWSWLYLWKFCGCLHCYSLPVRVWVSVEVSSGCSSSPNILHNFRTLLTLLPRALRCMSITRLLSLYPQVALFMRCPGLRGSAGRTYFNNLHSFIMRGRCIIVSIIWCYSRSIKICKIYLKQNKPVWIVPTTGVDRLVQHPMPSESV